MADEKVGEVLRDVSAALLTYARLPVAYWPEGGLFVNIRDKAWRHLTNGEFPKTCDREDGTHPGYVMERISNMALRLYACSTKNFVGKGVKYIPAGLKLEMTGHMKDATSYIVERAVVNLPLVRKFSRPPLFLGICPKEKLCVVTD